MIKRELTRIKIAGMDGAIIAYGEEPHQWFEILIPCGLENSDRAVQVISNILTKHMSDFELTKHPDYPCSGLRKFFTDYRTYVGTKDNSEKIQIDYVVINLQGDFGQTEVEALCKQVRGFGTYRASATTQKSLFR